MPASSSTEAAASRVALAKALFSPERIALIGASADAAKLGSRPQRVLRRHGYPGAIVPIHPVHDEICGSRAFRSVSAVPGGIDHALIMISAAAVPAAIADCCAAKVAVATIVTAGFAEAGIEGRRRQDEMLAAARASGTRIVGPNCLGIVNVSGNVAISANAVLEHEALVCGNLSVVSQSGSMLGAIVTRAQERGLGFSKLVSVGNECDVGVGELVHLLVDDPDTAAILLFLEAFRDAPVLAEAARRAFDAGKPVIALKLGRSSIGREVAATHTGAIAEDDRLTEAFVRAHGILRVENFEALFETAQLVLGHRPPKGRRVGVLTVSGGAAALVVDRLGLADIALVPPPAQIIAKLASRRIRITDAALTDLPMGRADGGAYAAILDELLASDHCDAVLAVQGSNATHMPESIEERILAAKRGAKPLAVFVGPRAERALHLLQQGGVAGFRTPEACADALRAYCDWRAPEPVLEVEPDEARRVRSAVAEAGTVPLNEAAACELLARLGIAFAPYRVVRTGNDPIDLPYPVAAKILSADIAHKTDVDGVALDIAGPAELARCIDALLARVRASHPKAKIDGVLVQPMQRGLGEAIIGFRRDPAVGPIVLVGAGGWLAEAGGGHAVRLAPVSIQGACEMIEAVPGLASLRGYRNRPAGDLSALAHALHRLSLLACADAVAEAEVNPLIVRSDGVVAVDALVTLSARLTARAR
jgi:acetate---CoA ligase (ADP-forming)